MVNRGSAFCLLPHHRPGTTSQLHQLRLVCQSVYFKTAPPLYSALCCLGSAVSSARALAQQSRSRAATTQRRAPRALSMGSGQSTKGKTEPPPLQRQRPQLQKQCAKCAMTCGMHTETCTRCGCRQFQAAPMDQMSSRPSSARLLPSSSPQMSGPASKDTERRPAKFTPAKQALAPLRQFSELTPVRLANNVVAPAPSE